MTQRKKNILFLCSWYPCRTSPDNGNFIERHIECLGDSVEKSVLAVVEDPNLRNKWFDWQFGNSRNVPHLIVYFRKTRIPFFKYFLKLLAYLKGYFYFKNNRPKFDLIHVHITIDAGFVAYLISFFSNTPYIITEQSTIFLENNLETLPKITKPLIRKAANRAKIVLPVSKYLEKNMKQLGINTPFQVIPNIVNTDLFKPIARSDNKPFKFIHVSAFQDFKNVPGILRAVKELSKKRTDFSMLIAGDGDILALQKLEKQLEIPPQILQFKGRMTENEVATTMQQCDSFVLFSNVETFGVVVVEALAIGMPVVASNVPCVVEILDGGNLGKIVPIGDEEALMKALEYMIVHSTDFDSLDLRNKAVNNYSKEKVKQKLLEVYTKITNGDYE